MGAVSEGRVVGGSNPGGGEGDKFLESFDSRATAVTSGAGLMDWCAVSRTLDASDADGVANAPSTVATSETAQDTRLVSTTRAHTSSPARGIGRGYVSAEAGVGGRAEFFSRRAYGQREGGGVGRCARGVNRAPRQVAR